MSENIVATALEQAEYTKAMEVGRGVISKTGDVVVDTSLPYTGPAIGTNTTGQEAEGPHCITGTAGGH